MSLTGNASGRPANGSLSKFGSLLTALGGALTEGGVASGGDVNVSGGQASFGLSLGGTGNQYSGSGGSSFLGHGGGAVQSDNAGNNGNGFGGGGSGAAGDSSSSAAAGGSGTGGIIIVTEFY